MTALDDDWWLSKIPKTEQVIWFGQPHQGYFPNRTGWGYRILLACLGLAWLASPWFTESLRDYWKLVSCTAVLAFLIWLDRLFRSNRIYVVSNRNVWWLSGIFKPKRIPVDSRLKFHRSGRNVVFSRHPFLVFEYLSDPDAAVAALTQAQEAST